MILLSFKHFTSSLVTSKWRWGLHCSWPAWRCQSPTTGQRHSVGRRTEPASLSACGWPLVTIQEAPLVPAQERLNSFIPFQESVNIYHKQYLREDYLHLRFSLKRYVIKTKSILWELKISFMEFVFEPQNEIW